MAQFLSLFFFNDTATTEIYTLSLHDALPISAVGVLEALIVWLKVVSDTATLAFMAASALPAKDADNKIAASKITAEEKNARTLDPYTFCIIFS